MQKVATAFLRAITLMLALAAAGVYAQSDSGTNSGFSLDDNFSPGLREFSLGLAPMFSPIGSDMNRPVVNWVEGYAQLGYMLTKIHGRSFWRGNLEFVGEAFGAGIYEETGNYIAGGSLMGRYNIIPEGSRLIPYLQAGVGGEMMDIDHKYDGHNFNFNVVAMGGLRYFARPKLSINVEIRYQHLSNANTGDRNIGINAVGPALGVSWFF
jgi:opacity protein-like surface antigen